MRNILVCGALFLLVSGCGSTPVKQTCINTDARTLGEFDGKAGEPAEISITRLNECNAEGGKFDTSLYTQGYIEGIKQYCSYLGGKKAGAKGKLYKPGTCPIELSEDFIKGYQEGHEIWDTDRAMRQAKSGSHGIGTGR